MFRCLVWGSGKVFNDNINLLLFFEMKREIVLAGITGNDTAFSRISDISFVPKSQIDCSNYDIVIIMSDKRVEIEKEAISCGFAEEQILWYKSLHIPNLNLKKFMDLKKSLPSILVHNCWGGLTCHHLGVEFRSPLVNMYLEEADYLKLLCQPKLYMQEELSFDYIAYSEYLQREFPVCKCGDIKLYCNHYRSFEHAKECWERRKLRINWDNLFVMFFTENEERAKEFDKLPYEKKICFVPFTSDLESVYTLDFCQKGEMAKKELWEIVNGMAVGDFYYYDVIELLNTGKVVTGNRV